MPLEGFVAERGGFEPPIDLRLCLISSQVHSTGLCHLSAIVYNNLDSSPCIVSIWVKWDEVQDQFGFIDMNQWALLSATNHGVA